MLVSSPRPKRSVTGFPDIVGNVCYKVLRCPDALRRAKTRNSGRSQNTRYINKISTLWIIYHQKGLDEEIPKQQTILRNLYSILRYKRNPTKMSKVLYHNFNSHHTASCYTVWTMLGPTKISSTSPANHFLQIALTMYILPKNIKSVLLKIRSDISSCMDRL